MFEMVVGLMYEMGGVRFCETRATMLYEMGVVQLYGIGFYYCLRREMYYTKRTELHNCVR